MNKRSSPDSPDAEAKRVCMSSAQITAVGHATLRRLTDFINTVLGVNFWGDVGKGVEVFVWVPESLPAETVVSDTLWKKAASNIGQLTAATALIAEHDTLVKTFESAYTICIPTLESLPPPTVHLFESRSAGTLADIKGYDKLLAFAEALETEPSMQMVEYVPATYIEADIDGIQIGRFICDLNGDDTPVKKAMKEWNDTKMYQYDMPSAEFLFRTTDGSPIKGAIEYLMFHLLRDKRDVWGGDVSLWGSGNGRFKTQLGDVKLSFRAARVMGALFAIIGEADVALGTSIGFNSLVCAWFHYYMAWRLAHGADEKSMFVADGLWNIYGYDEERVKESIGGFFLPTYVNTFEEEGARGPDVAGEELIKKTSAKFVALALTANAVSLRRSAVRDRKKRNETIDNDNRTISDSDVSTLFNTLVIVNTETQKLMSKVKK
jgi:hypothetical protein